MYDRPLESIKRGRMPSRSELNRMAEKVDQVSQISINGAGMTTQNDQLNVDMPTANRYNAKITGGSQPYSWITIVADESDDGTTWRETGEITAEVNDRIALWERSGNTNVPADTEGVVAELDPRSGLWYFDFKESTPRDLFPAGINPGDPFINVETGLYTYEWLGTSWDPLNPNPYDGIAGSGPAHLTISHTFFYDGISADVWQLKLANTPTAGNFHLHVNSVSYGPFSAPSVTTSILNTALTGIYTVTGTWPIFTLTDNTPGSGFVPTESDSGLQPSGWTYPATFDNEIPMMPGNFKLYLASGVLDATATVDDLAASNGTTTNQKIQITMTDTKFGILAITVDGGPVVSIDAAASAPDVQTAFAVVDPSCTATGSAGSYQVQFTDHTEHTFVLDTTLLTGTAAFTIVTSNFASEEPIAGTNLPLFPGFTAPLTPVVSIFGSGTTGPYTIRVSYAALGTYTVQLDGGTSYVAAYTTYPLFPGFTFVTSSIETTIVGLVRTFVLTGDGFSHTFVPFSSNLIPGGAVPQVLVYSAPGSPYEWGLQRSTPYLANNLFHWLNSLTSPVGTSPTTIGEAMDRLADYAIRINAEVVSLGGVDQGVP